MSVSRRECCNICEVKLAVAWCPECEDFLCRACDKYHSKSSSSKQHSVIAIENYSQLPSSILSIKNRCENHGNKYRYEFYCGSHEEPCCVMCYRETHKECTELIPITEVIKNAKSSSASVHLEEDLKDIYNTMNAVKAEIKNNMSAISERKDKLLGDITNLRTSMNKHLDTIEKALRQELSLQEQNLQEKLKEMLNGIESNLNKVKTMREDMIKIKRFSSDLQTFLAVKEMAVKANEEIKNLETLNDYECLNLDMELSEELLSFIDKVTSFGTVRVEMEHSKIPIQLESAKRAQALSTSTLNAISKPTKKCVIHKLPGGVNGISVRGCTILPDGKLILGDKTNKRIIICSNDGSCDNDFVNLSGKPFGISYVKNNIVAVTIPDKKEVVFVDVDAKMKVNSVDLGHRCFGIVTGASASSPAFLKK